MRQQGAQVDIAVPPGSFHLANLHVAPGYQDHGIGGQERGGEGGKSRVLGPADPDRAG